MLRKSIVNLLIVATLITSSTIIGCTKTKNDMDEAGEKIEDVTEKAGDAAKSGAEDVAEGAKDIADKGMDLVSKITDTSMEYSEDNFKADMNSKGFKLEEIEASKSFFSVDNDDYIVNGEKISLYEYDKSDKAKLESDIRTITNNGMVINGTEVKWTDGPHIYKKGRIVVLYDGSSTKILSALSETLGTPILG